MRGYTQLTQEERCFYIQKKAKYYQAEFAELLERDKSTISWELGRNRGLKGYRPPDTITCDNGREFADMKAWPAILKRASIRRILMRSWERGLNENTNGLIRQYFRKDLVLTTVTKYEIEQAMDKLNHRPRKSLGYWTAYEVFFNIRTSLAVALQS